MIGLIRTSPVVKEYAEFSGEDFPTLCNNVLNNTDVVREDFLRYNNPLDFYEKSNTYVYDLLIQNLSKQRLTDKLNAFSPLFFKNLFNKNYKSFCEFGGGVGLMCQLVKEIRPNLDVTYVDIKSRVSDFAIWRFNKYKIDIKTHIISQTDFSLNTSYDVIFTDAVFEHLDELQQIRYIRKISNYLNTGGVLVILIDLEGKNERVPMHYDVNVVNLHNNLESVGLTCVWGRNIFSSIWKKN